MKEVLGFWNGAYFVVADFGLSCGELDRVVQTADLVDQIAEQFDLVSANLTTKTILILLENVRRVLVQDGIFVCSGILETDKDEVLNKMQDLSFELIEILAKEEWISIACSSKENLT